MPKIISLLPAATEIVCALGLQDSLVGRSHECDFPAAVKHLPICSKTKLDVSKKSFEIDADVKNMLASALSIYDIDFKLIEQLQPDVIITQAQCEVCAVSLQDVERTLTNSLNRNCKVISLQPNTIADIFRDIDLIAETLNVRNLKNQLIEDMQERMDIISHKLKFFPEKPTVAMVEWLSPLMIAGNWIPEMVAHAGGTPIISEGGVHSPFIDWQAIYDHDPEIIVVAPCGFPIQKTLSEMDVLIQQPGWRDLQAVKNNKVYIADGNAYLNRSGPRIVDSIEIIAEIITPKYFSFGYEGNAWIKFEN